VSPKCDDKVDLDQLSDLITHIIDSEARSSSSSSNRKQSSSSATTASAASGEHLGALLVFLPGALEINRLVSMLRQVSVHTIIMNSDSTTVTHAS
jgi:HrpA-like RNA helicase